MMDEKVISELLKLILEAKMPEWWTNYAGQLAYNLQVHTKGLMFDKITGLYPNEHPDSQKHCINSYESITKGSIWKAINNIIRVFNNSSYNIQVSEKTREVIQQFQDNEGSLFSQFLEDWIKNAVATDPNGLCVVYPIDYSSDLYRYVSYKDIISVSDEYVVFKSESESEIQTSFIDVETSKEIFFDRNDQFGDEPRINVRHSVTRTFNRRLERKFIKTVYHAFTLTHFIRFYKENEGDKDYQYEWFAYPKPLTTLPYFESGGVELEDNLYESFVQAFVPFGNLALQSHRNQRAIDLMHAYPKMSEVQQECDECQATGKISTDAGSVTCKSCHGSKYVSIQSPYKVYRKVQDSFDQDGKVFSTPSVEYYSPPVAPMEFTNKQWKQYLKQAEEAVFVQQKKDTGNVESFEAKNVDREELYSWLANIAKVLYNNIEMFLQYVENYVNPSPIKVSVERPYSFAILTESEAFEELNTMLMGDAPVLLKANKIDNFINKFISESSPVKRALTILKKYDLLLYYSSKDIAALKGQGTVGAKMLQLHTLAYPILIQMYELDKTLFDLEDEQIIEKLNMEVEKYDLTKDLKTSLLNV